MTQIFHAQMRRSIATTEVIVTETHIICRSNKDITLCESLLATRQSYSTLLASVVRGTTVAERSNFPEPAKRVPGQTKHKTAAGLLEVVERNAVYLPANRSAAHTRG